MNKLLALVVFLAPVAALAEVPVGLQASGGAVITSGREVSGVQFDHFTGPVIRAGIELGDRFTSQFLIQATQSSGGAHNGLVDGDVSLQTAALGYTLNFDFFGKQGLRGFTPYLGGGLYLGAAHERVSSRVGDPAIAAEIGQSILGASDQTLPYVELHAEVGARYSFHNGVGVLGELAYSTYGGFGAVQPTLSIGYRF